MLNCEGYKMFRGVMRIIPKNSNPCKEIYTTWLYKPEYDCWYGDNLSFPAEICEIVEDRTI